MNEFYGIEDLSQLSGALKSIFITISVASARIYAAFTVLPATGESSLQGMTRAGLVIIMGAFVAFGTPAEHLTNATALELGLLVLKEALIGMVLGFCASTVFWVAQCVGALIDTQAGYNSVQLTNPMSGEQSTPVSDLLLQLVITVFYTLGGMLVFMGALFESYKVWPLHSAFPSFSGAAQVFFLQEVDGLMTSIIKFAAPALLVLLLIDLGFGLITRAADKLQPSSLSQPIKGAVTMLLLALLTGVFVTQVRHMLLPLDLLHMMQSMMPKG